MKRLSLGLKGSSKMLIFLLPGVRELRPRNVNLTAFEP